MQKLRDSGGRTIVHSISGKSYAIRASADGVRFFCPDLPHDFSFSVFDIIVDLLLKQGGKARKGGARFAKIGDPVCDATTIAGAIGMNYFGKKEGESILDPVFVLASVLDWAGIAHNRRGYLELTATYKASL